MVDKEETAIVEPTLHPAVELLLARMKSNPDEFYPKGWRWQKLIVEYSGYFTAAEHVAINEGQREIAIGAFHVAVMNELLREPEEVKAVTTMYAQRAITTGTGNASIDYSQRQNTGVGVGATQLAQITTQDLMRQMQSAQQAYTNNTPTPAGVAKPKGWLGGIF